MSSTTLSSFISADKLGFVSQESLKHGIKLQEKAAELQEQIAKIQEEADKKIAPLQAEIKQLISSRDRIIQEHQTNGIYEEDSYYVAIASKPKFLIDAAAFREKYPDEFKKVYEKVGFKKFKPSKDEAALELSTFQIEKICKASGEYTYRIEQDLHALMPEKAAEVEL